MSKENFSEHSAGQKLLWWAETGGVVAALIGAFGGVSGLITEGVLVAVGAKVTESVVYSKGK
jgi:hypothetical protein